MPKRELKNAENENSAGEKESSYWTPSYNYPKEELKKAIEGVAFSKNKKLKSVKLKGDTTKKQ